MNQESKNKIPEALSANRLRWGAFRKWAAVTAVVATLMVSLCGCDDILTPFVDDIPFEQEQTTPPEMGAVDNVPTVPDDSFGDEEFLPLQ